MLIFCRTGFESMAGAGAGWGWGSVSARLGCFFGAVFLVAGVKTTYLPVWLDARGLTASEIGLLSAAPMLLRIVAAPLIGYAADAFGQHRLVIIGLAWLAFALSVLLVPAHGFWPILAVALTLSLASMALVPLTETMAMASVRRSGIDYGRMRLWGSLTFIVAAFAAGFGVDSSGPEAALWFLIGASFITGLAALALPGREPEPSGGAPAALRGVSLGDVTRLLTARQFLWLLMAVGAIQSAHAVFYVFGVLHWQRQGLSSVTASTLWMVGVAAEVVLFAFSGAAVRAVGAIGLIALGAAASIVRWLAMSWDPGLPALYVLQALHGLTYGATHLGAVHVISAIVPAQQAGTAQSLYSSATSGIAMALATLLAGKLFPVYGGGAYLAMAALAGLGAAACLMMHRSAKHRTDT